MVLKLPLIKEQLETKGRQQCKLQYEATKAGKYYIVLEHFSASYLIIFGITPIPESHGTSLCDLEKLFVWLQIS